MSYDDILGSFLRNCLPSDRLSSIGSDPPADLPFFTRYSAYGWALLKLKLNATLFEQQFTQLKNNQQRVALILTEPQFVVSMNELVALIMSDGENRSMSKCINKATKAKEKGNAFFKRKLMEEALLCYNEAILWAPPASEQLAICFANRSAVFFHLNKFKDALLDIEEAMAREYPAERTPILLIRRVNCFMSLGEEREARRVGEEAEKSIDNNVTDKGLRLTLRQQLLRAFETQVSPETEPLLEVSLKEPNQRLFGANSSVKMGFNEEKGRTIEATRDLEEGQVILVESPFASWLDPPYYTQYCHHCLQPLKGRVIPCSDCPLVRFCSKACSDNGWMQYHRVECPHLETIKHLKYCQMALRVALRVGVDEAAKGEKSQAVSFLEWPRQEFKQDLRSIASLYTHETERTFRDLFGFAFISVTFAVFAEKISLVHGQDKPGFAAFLMRVLMQLDMNGYNVQDEDLEPSPFPGLFLHKPEKRVIGWGLYGTASLFSHRCFPKTRRRFFGSKMVVTVTDSIKRGEEVTITYWGQGIDKSYEDRQKYLRNSLKFTCCCTDCANKREPPKYRCPKCDGNLVINEDSSNYCTECGERKQSTESMLSLCSLAKKRLTEGRELLEKGLAMKAETPLIESETLLARTLQKDNNQQVHVKATLSRCLEAQGRLEEAAKYCLQAAYYEKMRSGDASFQMLGFWVKLVLLSLDKGRATLKERQKSISEASDYLQLSLKLMDRINRMEFKVATRDQIQLIYKLEHLKRTINDATSQIR